MMIYPNDHEKWPGGFRAALVATVTNHGSQPAQIGRVWLGGNHRGIFLPAEPEGPKFPTVVEPRGGSANWTFDYEGIKEAVQGNYHFGEVTLQAQMSVGRRKIKARPKKTVVEYQAPQAANGATMASRESPRKRLEAYLRRGRNWFRMWTRHPILLSPPFVPLSEDVLQHGSIQTEFRVHGHRPVPAHRLVLVAHIRTEGGWRMKRVEDVEPVHVPMTWPGQVRHVQLPLVPELVAAQPDTDFHWHSEPDKCHQGYLGAHTVPEIRDLLSQSQRID
jgi:hypothetical protein